MTYIYIINNKASFWYIVYVLRILADESAFEDMCSFPGELFKSETCRCLIVVLLLPYCCPIIYWTTIGQLLDNDWTTIGQGVEVRGRCGGGVVEVDDDKERPRPKAQPFFCM